MEKLIRYYESLADACRLLLEAVPVESAPERLVVSPPVSPRLTRPRDWSSKKDDPAIAPMGRRRRFREVLAQFDRDVPKSKPRRPRMWGFYALIRHGYLLPLDGGYVRTGKEYPEEDERE